MTEPFRVLVVDDDYRVATLHHDIVAARPEFVALDPVHTLAAARDAIAASRPDLLLVDGYLPDGHGSELVAETSVDAFMLTAAADVVSVRRAQRAGALGTLIKPFDRKVLDDRLDRWVRFRNLMDRAPDLTQVELDRAFAVLYPGRDAASGVRTPTEQVVSEALGDGESSAAEVAERAGVSRATAQRHLAALASRGLVDVRLRYGSAGRPEHLYSPKR